MNRCVSKECAWVKVLPIIFRPGYLKIVESFWKEQQIGSYFTLETPFQLPKKGNHSSGKEKNLSLEKWVSPRDPYNGCYWDKHWRQLHNVSCLGLISLLFYIYVVYLEKRVCHLKIVVVDFETYLKLRREGVSELLLCRTLPFTSLWSAVCLMSVLWELSKAVIIQSPSFVLSKQTICQNFKANVRYHYIEMHLVMSNLDIRLCS